MPGLLGWHRRMTARLDPLALLERSGLELARPFTTATARAAGLTSKQLTALVGAGLLLHPVRGVFHGAHLTDSLRLRVACLALVVPADAVVTDRTAAWVHGAEMALAPGSHLVVPRVSVFLSPGNRLRNDLAVSGERRFRDEDVVEIRGVPVTTPLRTACDLGRLLHRDSAFAALDALAGLESFTVARLVDEVARFRGYRGVRQLRAFAPRVDPGSESFGESVLRLRWYDAGCAGRPQTQILVRRRGSSEIALLDIGNPATRYAAEYDGEAFHGPEQEQHDTDRRAWITDQGWTVDVFRKKDLFGRHQDVHGRLLAGTRLAALRSTYG